MSRVVSARELNRATLARQLLLGREALDAAEGVRRVVALQAQHPASPYVALWNRLASFDPARLDDAFAAGSVVKGSLMRITLHAVHADDHAAFHVAMRRSLRASCLGDPRFTRSGLDAAGADALVPALVEFAGTPRANAELEAFLARHVAAHPEGAWWALRRLSPLQHAVTGGPWSFGQRPAYVAAPALRELPGEEAASRHLARRYLEGFGPASAEDLAAFTTWRRPRARRVLEDLDLVELEGPDGERLHDVPGGVVPDEGAIAPPRLMAMWDSVLLAYADRGRVIPPDLRAHVTRRNGDVLPTLLVDGRVAGVWRPVDGRIEATAFHPVPEDDWAALEREARSLLGLLAGRDPDPYRRFHNWWAKLPPGRTRVLAG